MYSNTYENEHNMDKHSHITFIDATQITGDSETYSHILYEYIHTDVFAHAISISISNHFILCNWYNNNWDGHLVPSSWNQIADGKNGSLYLCWYVRIVDYSFLVKVEFSCERDDKDPSKYFEVSFYKVERLGHYKASFLICLRRDPLFRFRFGYRWRTRRDIMRLHQ